MYAADDDVVSADATGAHSVAKARAKHANANSHGRAMQRGVTTMDAIPSGTRL
jgi:hypothetical protein